MNHDTANSAVCLLRPETDPWTYHMRRGDFAAAWRICDRVLREHASVPCSHLPRHQQWVWNGTPLHGKRVLIRCYHGLGDTVQFIRFAPLVREHAREVIVWAQPELIPLLRTMRGNDRLLPLHDGTPEVDYDVDVESMELAHVLRTTLATLPATVPYLHSPRAERTLDPDLLHVGLVWSVGNWDRQRSLSISALKPLLETPRVCLHVLQRGDALREWPRDVGLISGRDRIEETAAVMRALDLVISVDSFPAHLAGALGIPVWTLLLHEADWRWMIERDDSPWYPTMRLFRQPRDGDWTSVIAQVTSELAQRAACRERAARAAPISSRPIHRGPS
jgi:hypothetical protein